MLRVCGYCPYSAKGGVSADPIALTLQFTLAFNVVVRSYLTKKPYKSDPDNVLRIFLAPEWTFRQPDTEIEVEGRKRKVKQFLAAGEMGVILKELIKISATAKDVLIVAGSILWAIPGKIQVNTKNGEVAEGVALVYNTTPILCGGKIVHFYHKQFFGFDCSARNGQVFAFDPQGTTVGLSRMDSSPIKKNLSAITAKLKTKAVNLDREELKAVDSNTFKHAGLHFGIEICADHCNQALVKACAGSEEEVDVQILVSCGMRLFSDSIAARKGGVAIHIDGANPKEANMKKICFGWQSVTAVSKKGKKTLTPLEYIPDKKKFIGEHPRLSFIYEDLIELK